MRVLLVTQALGGGGAERFMGRLARETVQRAHEAHVATLTPGQGYEEWNDPGITLHSLDCRARAATVPIVRLTRAIGADILVSSIARVNLGVLLGRPLLPRATGIVVREAYSPKAALSRLPHRRLTALGYRTLYPLADRVVCQSLDMAAEMARSFGLEGARVRVIANPAPISEGMEADRSPSPYPPRASNERVLVAAGRLAVQKDYPTLLRAFAAASADLNECLNLRLSILGDGPDLGELRNLSVSLGIDDRVEFRGWVADPFPWLAHADLFCLASHWEGFSNALVEALACGVPVVAADGTGANKEVVIPGENGYLFTPGDHAAMAAAISSLLREPPDRRPVRQSVARYAPERIWEQYFDMFQELIGART